MTSRATRCFVTLLGTFASSTLLACMADLAYLQSLYNEINQVGNDGLQVTCPQCQHAFEAEQSMAGGSWATPTTNSSGR